MQTARSLCPKIGKIDQSMSCSDLAPVLQIDYNEYKQASGLVLRFFGSVSRQNALMATWAIYNMRHKVIFSGPIYPTIPFPSVKNFFFSVIGIK